MSNLKRFLDKQGISEEYLFKGGGHTYVGIEELGMFFWERGGKEFAKDVLEHEKTTGGKMNDFPYVISEAEFYLDGYEDFTGNTIKSTIVMQARDFLDCVACLGEEKVKELIRELEAEGKQK